METSQQLKDKLQGTKPLRDGETLFLNKQQNDKKQSSPHTVVRREYCSSIL